MMDWRKASLAAQVALGGYLQIVEWSSVSSVPARPGGHSG